MKVLDRYLTRELVTPIVYCSAMLIFLILIADLFDNLDSLLSHKTPPLVMLQYYLSLIPYAFTQTIPWAAWVGTIFLLVNFGFHNETIAMKAAGLKITTIVRPILFMGFLIGILTFVVSDRLVPQSSRKAAELHDLYIEKKKNDSDKKVFHNVTFYYAGDQLYFFRSFSKKQSTVEGVVALWSNEAGRRSRHKMVARKGTWTDKGWMFEGVNEFQMDSMGRILGEPQAFESKIYPEINFSPHELALASTDTRYLTYRELNHSIEKLRENGVSVEQELVDLHERLSTPWQSLVMMIIAIPFLARTTNRKLIAYNVLICIGIIFAYHVSAAVGIALGKAGKLMPFISAWSANILFGIAAFLQMEKANY